MLWSVCAAMLLSPLLFTALFSPPVHAQEPPAAEPPQWRFRPITFEVRGVDGQPLAHWPVQLVGMGRDSGYTHYPRNVTTDAAGRCTVEFGAFRTWDYDQFLEKQEKQAAQKREEQAVAEPSQTKAASPSDANAAGDAPAPPRKNAPGRGRFYLIAAQPNTAGGVSPAIYNDLGLSPEKDKNELEELAQWQKRCAAGTDGPMKDDGGGVEDNEWCVGPFQPIRLSQRPADAPPIVVRIRRGITVTGRILDPQGRPLPGQPMGAFLDLHANSHTGRGGELFQGPTQTTDAHGRYRLEHIYPNTFYLGDGSDYFEMLTFTAPYSVWLKTRVRGGKWRREMVDKITPRPGEQVIRVDLVLAKQSPYRYAGRVTDSAGRPVAGAKVTLAVSFHKPSRTHGDSHHFLYAETDAQGRYELRAETRFVRGFAVDAPGFARKDQWNNDDGDPSWRPFPPGTYHFTLQPEPPRQP